MVLPRRRLPRGNKAAPGRSGRNSGYLLLLNPPQKKPEGLLPAPVPQEQGQGRMQAVGPARSVEGLPRPGRKPPVKRYLPRLHQKAEALSCLPARQEAGTAPIRKAPAVPGTEAPARPGGDGPMMQRASFRKEALLPSTPVRQELAAVLPCGCPRRKNAVPVRLGRNRARAPRPPKAC